MSTKAFDFYIMDVARLNEFLGWAKKAVAASLIPIIYDNQKLKKIFEKRWHEEEDEVLKKVQESLLTHSNFGETLEDYHLKGAFSVWIWGDKAVVHPYGRHGLRSIEYPDYVKNYDYWNNTDQPEEDEVSAEEWREREEFYETTIDDLHRMDYIPFDFLKPMPGTSWRELQDFVKVKKDE